jgi:hypothetical protein
VLVSAGNDWSGDTTESKEVSGWIGIDCSDSKVMGIWECCSRYQKIKIFFRGCETQEEFFMVWS